MTKKAKILEEAGSHIIVELGDTVRDSITGFEGIVEGITLWRYGCRRISIRPIELGKDGKRKETEVIDEPALHIIKRADIPKKVAEERRSRGGPKSPAEEARAFSR